MKRILILLAMMVTLFATPAYAASQAGYDMYHDLWHQIDGQVGGEDEEMIKRMLNSLFVDYDAYINSDKYGGTIEDGYDIIEAACAAGFNEKKGFFGVSNECANYTRYWKSIFRQYGEMAGLDQGDFLTATLFGNGALFDSSAKATQDETENLIVLTWNKTNTNAQGAQVGHSGQILNIITAFDTQLSDFITLIVSISVALAIAYGTYNIIQMSMERSLTTDAATKEFISLLFGVWVLLNYKYFALLLIRLGTLLTETISNVAIQGAAKTAATTSTMAMYESLQYMIENRIFPSTLTTDMMMGSISVLQTPAGSTQNSILSAISTLGGAGVYQFALSLIVYAIAIEIAVRYLFTPIAIADLYSDKMRSSGVNWLKKLLASSLQGAIVFAIVYGHVKLKATVSLGSTGGTAINLCTLGMLASSKVIAKEIVGAH